MRLRTFEERYRYLRLFGNVADMTFGSSRYLNQSFYKSREWKNVRDHIILRDESCDLAISDRSIFGNVRVHHMNPISVDDIKENLSIALDPDFLICCSLSTHNAIHFGDEDNLVRLPIERRKGDTTPWKAF